MRPFIVRAALLVLPVALAACGGGGDSAPGLSLSLSPGSVSVNITGGQSYAFIETGTVSGSISGTVLVQILDSAGVLNPDVQLEPLSDTRYRAHLSTVDTLSAGEHRGSFTVNLCGDNNCTVKYASAALPYDFNVSNPAPALSGVSARSASAGCKGFALTVAGEGFVAGTQLLWNGQPRATAAASPTSLTSQITDADLAAAGAATLSVSTPPPGGGTTATVTFTVNAETAATDATAQQNDAAHSGAARMACPPSLPATSLWSVNFNGAVSTPVILQDGVFDTANTADGGTLYSLNPATGATAWSKSPLNDSADALSTLTYDSGRLFVAGSMKYVQAFDPADGTRLWKTDTTATHAILPHVHTPPVAANGRLYVFSTGESGANAFVQAYDQAAGTLAWQQRFGDGNDGVVPAATTDGIYVALPCTTSKYTPANGTLVWSNHRPEDNVCGSFGGGLPVVAGGKVYSPDLAHGSDGHIHDASSGGVTADLTADQPPAVDGQHYYVVMGDVLTATDLVTGQAAWTFHATGLITAPIVVNELVFVGCAGAEGAGDCHTGKLFALDAATGVALWSADVPGLSPGPANGAPLRPTLAAAHGLLIAPGGGTLTAFRIAEK